MRFPLLDDFVLVGGTSLALQIGHRASVDLDFFTLNEFETDDIIALLEEHYSAFHINYKGKNTLIVEINNIKVDFIRFRYQFQNPVIIIDNFRLLTIEDIALMKLDAINGRGRKKDFYDIFYLLEIFKLDDLLDKYKKMFLHDSVFQLIKSLTYFADAENDPDPKLIGGNVSWNEIKIFIQKQVAAL